MAKKPKVRHIHMKGPRGLSLEVRIDAELMQKVWKNGDVSKWWSPHGEVNRVQEGGDC